MQLTRTRRNASRRTVGITLATLALAVTACAGESESNAATASVDQETTTTTAATTTTEGPSTTAVVATEEGPKVLEYRETVLWPGDYESAKDDVAIRFTIPDNGPGYTWYGVSQNQWGLNVVVASPDNRENSSRNEQPGITLSVAETGSTMESTAAAMESSQAGKVAWARTDEQFTGRPAIVLRGDSLKEGRDTASGPEEMLVATGEESKNASLYKQDRQYLSYVFEIDDRIAVVTIDANRDDFDLALAEFSPILESAEFATGS